MRVIFLCIAALLILIQYPLWLGKGGWLRARDLDNQVVAAQQRNDELRARNAKLQSEVQDLQQGTEAVEERARFELGMIRDDEIFVQVVGAGKLPVPDPAEVEAAAAAKSNKKPATRPEPRR